MPVRKDRESWPAEEDAWLREMAERGIPVPKQHHIWPTRFHPRTLAAIRCRRAQLGIKTNPNAAIGQSVVPPRSGELSCGRESNNTSSSGTRCSPLPGDIFEG